MGLFLILRRGGVLILRSSRGSGVRKCTDTWQAVVAGQVEDSQE